jgi:hypothetical protein
MPGGGFFVFLFGFRHLAFLPIQLRGKADMVGPALSKDSSTSVFVNNSSKVISSLRVPIGPSSHAF